MGRGLPSLEKLRAGLSWRGLPAASIVLSLLLCGPSLSSGAMADDYVHQLILSDNSTIPGYRTHLANLFRFASVDINPSLQAVGILPWWSDPDLNFSFFRPLSALTHAIDHRWLDLPVWAMHVHNLLWSAAALFATFGVFRRVMPAPAAAAIGLLFYALDPTRAVAVGWIANRNSLIALCVSMVAVRLYLDGLAGHRTRARLSPWLMATAVLCAESGLSGLAYLVAAALCFDPRPRWRALSGLLPHVALGLGVIFIGRALGFGVFGSAAYLDPRQVPLQYLAHLPARAVTLLAASFGGPSADASGVYDLLWPGLGPVMLIACALITVLWGAALWPTLRSNPTARFFAIGAGLSLLPATVASPSDRLLGWVGIGVSGLFALLVHKTLLKKQQAFPLFLKVTISAILLTRLVVAPGALLAQSTNVGHVRSLLDQADAAIGVNRANSSRVDIFVNAPQDPLVSFVPAVRAAQGRARPIALRRLGTGLSAMAVTRTSDTTLYVVQDGGFLQHHTERLTRDPGRRPFAPEDRISLSAMTATVRQVTPDGRPFAVEFEFQASLDSEQIRLHGYRDGRYIDFELPGIGECKLLAATPFWSLIAGPNSALSKWTQPAEPDAALCSRPSPPKP